VSIFKNAIHFINILIFSLIFNNFASMDINSKIIMWVEYCMCEAIIDIYPKITTNTDSVSSFCRMMKNSINNSSLYSKPLNKSEDRVIRYMMFRAKREYRIPDDRLSEICANFFLDEKWSKYVRVINLMKNVNYRL
jgi:hypothetical protein